MISLKIPEVVPYKCVLNEVSLMIQKGVRSLEWSVRLIENNQLIVCWKGDGDERTPVLLDDLFDLIKKQSQTIQILLNLSEPHLERFGVHFVDKWDLYKQVNYTGEINPSTLTLWERQRVHYHVEQCLPNFYQLEQIKSSHLDVIHYFMNRSKVKTLRLHKRGLTDSVIDWAKENDLSLSLYGVNTFSEAEQLIHQGIDFVSITDHTFLQKETSLKAI